ESTKVIHLHSGKLWGAHLATAKLFQELQGELCICDPYYGIGSLLRLSELAHCNPIRFLTQRADSKERSFIGKALKDFTSQHTHVEFRQYTANDLHDRYLLTASEIVILGHGLKDIGGKESFVIRLNKDTCGDVIDTESRSFDSRWSAATQLP
ncbi:MAG: hypothetical protein ABSB35_29980, partial [Bryobacteraceae bacterium]